MGAHPLGTLRRVTFNEQRKSTIQERLITYNENLPFRQITTHAPLVVLD